MTGRINKENKTITELPTMDKPHPVIDDADDSEYWGKKVREYQNHLASLRTFPYSGEWKAETGDIVSFATVYQGRIEPKESSPWYAMTEEEYPKYPEDQRRIVAIPIPGNHPEEKPQEPDLFMLSLIENRDAMKSVEIGVDYDGDVYTDMSKRMIVEMYEDIIEIYKSLRPSPKDTVEREAEDMPESEAVKVLNWLLAYETKADKFSDRDSIIISDGDFYWKSDGEGDQPMDGDDIYNLYKKVNRIK